MAIVAQVIAAANAHFHPGVTAVEAGVLIAAVLSEVACSDVTIEFIKAQIIKKAKQLSAVRRMAALLFDN